MHPMPGLRSFCSNTPRQQQTPPLRTRRVLMRHASQSHPHGGRGTFGLENALTGHLEVRARSLTHGLRYVDAYKSWSWWSSGRTKVTRTSPHRGQLPWAPIILLTVMRQSPSPTSRFHCSGMYLGDPTLRIVPTHPLYQELFVRKGVTHNGFLHRSSLKGRTRRGLKVGHAVEGNVRFERPFTRTAFLDHGIRIHTAYPWLEQGPFEHCCLAQVKHEGTQRGEIWSIDMTSHWGPKRY